MYLADICIISKNSFQKTLFRPNTPSSIIENKKKPLKIQIGINEFYEFNSKPLIKGIVL